ncbi:MAG: tRNA pseudouridine(38-40) synthase TruA [Lachnospiraceae bacterium]|nr:tRNA pseudouridine(38-40) synthase TruA [Lachnospiraceae bacterium]
MPRRILIKVSYDGTAYHGWQLQGDSPTVALRLQEAYRALFQEDTEIKGASRTDAGVHAEGNLATFDTSMRMDGRKFAKALNTRLPEDIRVLSSVDVDMDFSLREARSEKTYIYRIIQSEIGNPLHRLYAWQLPWKLDLSKMDRAASFFVGEHDFKSFASVYTQAKTTVREVTYTGLSAGGEEAGEAQFGLDTGNNKGKSGREIIFKVKGYGFLYNMVRIMVGTLVEIGRGRFEPERIQDILKSCDRRMAGPTAPPQGLTLKDIKLLDHEGIWESFG